MSFCLLTASNAMFLRFDHCHHSSTSFRQGAVVAAEQKPLPTPQIHLTYIHSVIKIGVQNGKYQFWRKYDSKYRPHICAWYVDPSGGDVGTFSTNLANNVDADAMAPCVTRTSVTVISIRLRLYVSWHEFSSTSAQSRYLPDSKDPRIDID